MTLSIDLLTRGRRYRIVFYINFLLLWLLYLYEQKRNEKSLKERLMI